MIKDFEVAFFLDEAKSVIALNGEARFTISEKLDEAFLTINSQSGLHYDLIIDVTRVTFIDSTILGLIAGYAIQRNELVNSQITIFYDDRDIGKQFYILGLDQLCLLKAEPSPFGSLLDRFTVVAQKGNNEAQLLNNVNKAHKTLAGLTNDPAIKNVVDETRKPSH